MLTTIVVCLGKNCIVLDKMSILFIIVTTIAIVATLEATGHDPFTIEDENEDV